MTRPVGLQQRIATALVLLLAVLLVLFLLPPAATLVVVVASIGAGAWEWSAFLGVPERMTRWRRAAYVALVLAVLAALVGWAQDSKTLFFVMAIAAHWWLIAFLWIVLAPARGGPRTTAIAGVLTLAPLGLALGALRGVEVLQVWQLLFVLLVIMAADVGAYFAGHAFGRTKLAPQVSPGKSWEGVFGGLLVAGSIAAWGAGQFGWPLWHIVLLALGAVAFSIVGDLTESLMKRHSGLKDSGHLLPGHGGVLDRLDSLAAGVPILLLGLLQGGWVAANGWQSVVEWSVAALGGSAGLP
jgi:phosphatidate cytidylyltransferase